MDNPSIVVTGAHGQLGRDMVSLLEAQGYRVYGFGSKEMDVTQINQVEKIMQELSPGVVIHCGAYTKVDQAEAEPEEAYLVNGYGTRNIALAAGSVDAKLVYVSTDYVFDGNGRTNYDEFVQPNPINIYGRSKWMGEQFVQRFHNRSFIVRTWWVYGLHGNNFVKTMIKLGTEKKSISVVDDQIGCPTYTEDLAGFIGKLITGEMYGTYHYSNSGHCSWYQFAKAIFKYTGLDVEVIPVSSDQFIRPAKRPSYSVFDHQALKLNGFDFPRNWEVALKDFLDKYKTWSEKDGTDTSFRRIG